MSFKPTVVPSTEQMIFGDRNLIRGISVLEKSINIYGCTQAPLKLTYKPGKWNTVGVLWKYSGDRRGYFYLNGKEGQFVTSEVEADAPSEILIGSVYNGALLALDIITDSGEIYPKVLRDLVIDDHNFRT